MKKLTGVIAFLLFAALSTAALAHEIRPAYLEITAQDSGGYRVNWKQPTLGDRALRLIPHLSNGWLERVPDDQYTSGAFLIRTWNIAPEDAGTLSGAAIEVEGLDHSITDVLLRVRQHDGRSIDAIIRPDMPTFVLPVLGQPGVSIPTYFKLGLEHILAGADHLLFVFALMMIVRGRVLLLKTVTAFTVAHSLTLAATVVGKLSVAPAFVEAMIALSIFFLAPEILRRLRGETSLTLRYPWGVAFVFGLFHGMGFASGLAELGFDRDQLFASLLLFNLGVEAGQLAFIAGVFALMYMLRRSVALQPKWMPKLSAYIVGIAGAFWTIQTTVIWLGGAV